jgi:type II secretory pathway pseudopilin PulG
MRVPGIRIGRSGGITIVELMLALMAVMVLAGLAWKGATSAVNVANNSRVTAEIGKMNEALEAFALRFGEYPPDFHDTVAVWKFLKRRFPECPWQRYPSFCGHSPASALYFWLGGPDGRGFSTNPANPFDNCAARIGPFFRFTPDQLKRVDGIMQYYPPRGIDGAPYLYFRGGPKGYDGHPGCPPVRPYRNSKDGKWIYPDSYQILSPGADGEYGSGNHFPGGVDYDDANLDDMASFSQGETMGQAKPKGP